MVHLLLSIRDVNITLKVFGVRNANSGKFVEGPDDQSHRLVDIMRTNYVTIYQRGHHVPLSIICNKAGSEDHPRTGHEGSELYSFLNSAL